MHLIILPNVERMHPYQRRRASLTGLGLWLRKIIETKRLVGVECRDLLCLLDCDAVLALDLGVNGEAVT